MMFVECDLANNLCSMKQIKKNLTLIIGTDLGKTKKLFIFLVALDSFASRITGRW